MNEIEKMYKNANIKAKEYCDRDSDACMSCCPEWENRQDCWKYKSVIPSFTAKKQIELIKWLALRDGITIVAYIGGIYSSEHDKYNVSECSLESCLARLINNLWQSLTEKEKRQITDILK